MYRVEVVAAVDVDVDVDEDGLGRVDVMYDEMSKGRWGDNGRSDGTGRGFVDIALR